MNNDKQPVYAAFIPNSPQRYIFNELREVNQFLNSPDKKFNKSVRFKKCFNDVEVDSFYNESLHESSLNERLALSSNALPAEFQTPFSEPEPPRLNRFRMWVERKDNKKFDESIQQNPRFVINTTVDGPTILHGSQRHNVMHVACQAGNLYVVDTILQLCQSSSFLQRAYGTVVLDYDTLSAHLLDTLLNTPDKNANNTPLHFACKGGHLAIVERLVAFSVCRREPLNRFNQIPMDLVCLNFQGISQEKQRVSIEIRRLLYSITTTPKKLVTLNGDQSVVFNGSFTTSTMLLSVDEKNEQFFDALDHITTNDTEDDSDDEFFDAYEPLADSIDRLINELDQQWNF